MRSIVPPSNHEDRDLRVIECSEADGERWDAFVKAHRAGSFFHLFGWRTVFERALAHRTYYLAAEDADGAIRGILPLVYMRSLLFGRSLSSLPFTTAAGPLALEYSARQALEDAASDIGEKLGVGAIEFRLLEPGGRNRLIKTLYEVFYKLIEPDEEANMRAIRSKQRNVIRKGIKNGLVARLDTVGNFYPVYAESVHNLGTPVFPRALFETLQAMFPQEVEIMSAYHGETIISSAMTFSYAGIICPYYWGGVGEARRLNGNDFLAWQILCRAAEQGLTRFDFGRSKKGTGSYDWKVNLGFEPVSLYYEYQLVRDQSMPDVNPLNPRYRLMIEIWKKLPLPVATRLGPFLSRTLG